MSYNDDRRKRRVKPTSSQHVSDWPDRTVQIETGLRSRSPKNGNISNIRRRLSEIYRWKWPNLESGDQRPIYKSPLLAGIIAITKDRLPECRTAWLGREDSNLRMVESKSTALPLGDAPTDRFGKRRDVGLARIPLTPPVYRVS